MCVHRMGSESRPQMSVCTGGWVVTLPDQVRASLLVAAVHQFCSVMLAIHVTPLQERGKALSRPCSSVGKRWPAPAIVR